MTDMIRPTYATIDLAAAARNVRAIRSSLADSVKMMAVVKADAYGHGLVRFSRVALQNGAACLAVAVPEEGVRLREAGITAPIVILGPIMKNAAEAVVQYDLQPTVFNAEILRALDAEAKRAGKWVPVHVKLDTGMGRIGIREDRELDRFLDSFKGCSALELHAIYTHYANSDGADKGYAHEQFNRFNELKRRITGRGFSPIVHTANSAAIADMPETHADMVRAGIMMYGYYPSKNVKRDIPLIPVMSLYTKVAYVKTVPAGHTISYDRTFTTWRPTAVATLPIGYGDGYKRALSGRASVLIHGVRAPVLGRVCMDQIMVDVTEIAGVAVGDDAVLLGRQGAVCIDADELAELAGTISYEIMLSVSDRVPKIYIEE